MADRYYNKRLLYRALAYPPQALGVVLLYGFFAILPVDAASAIGGWLGRNIGLRLGITKRALRNIERALPELDAPGYSAAMEEMWDNLGRVVAELPHLRRITAERVEIIGEENIVPFRRDGNPCIVFSGHFANWEILPPVARHIGIPCVQVYRAANNPLVDGFMRWVRRFEDNEIAPKGPRGARRAISALKEGRCLGILIDQKMNDGIAVPFFGRDAMTAPAPAQLGLRHECPIVPARLERLGGCHFRVTLNAPLDIPKTGDRKADVATVMRSVNALFEDWIRTRPGQWLWLHRRWPDS